MDPLVELSAVLLQTTQQTEGQAMPRLSDYVKLAEAAEILGVAPNTMRTWADQGKVPVTRSPSGYRLFRREDLESFLKGIAEPLDRNTKPK